MRRTELMQKAPQMRFEEPYEGLCGRTFRRYLVRYEERGMEGLVDQRLGQVSHRCAQ